MTLPRLRCFQSSKQLGCLFLQVIISTSLLNYVCPSRLGSFPNTYCLFCTDTDLSSAIVPHVGGKSALLIPELRPEDLQDNILATVGDALTTLLEEELAAKVANQSAMTQSTESSEQAESTDAEGKLADVVLTQYEA